MLNRSHSKIEGNTKMKLEAKTAVGLARMMWHF
jgi:hypothetical protein